MAFEGEWKEEGIITRRSFNASAVHPSKTIIKVSGDFTEEEAIKLYIQDLLTLMQGRIGCEAMCLLREEDSHDLR